ncbi:hypothetical protein AMATHDRAFT_50768 [Amanita thiersii Skay4041]|uniref:VTT domain-containing protein n=1 Tax=Amanita thiersii Skay4041 TaxID=703135 RepID=A0A2A9NEX1_9AGAR|nr:hypothetical protein AMATHDRAFT_50768 [Amanita thiersii Skay4041]
MSSHPPPLSGPAFTDTASTYTLQTVRDDAELSSASDRAPLITPLTPSYGTTARSPTRPSPRKVILNATMKMALIFVLSSLALGGTLWLALPTLDEADRPMLRIPKSFTQLQDLNTLLKKYRDIYPYRIIICYVTTYLLSVCLSFLSTLQGTDTSPSLQAFSLPGSMYLSILGGAVWGVARALPLACCCVATGASLCYLISAALGPALLTLPKWKSLMDKWGRKIQANKENMISFLIVLRIAPLPPHWVVNVICPHVGIGLVPFWISTALGILGVSVIHTTIGGGLEEMTSADDFHLISWRNFFGLAAVVVGVMIPVGLRYWFKREVDKTEDDEEQEESDGGEDRILASGGLGSGVKKVDGENGMEGESMSEEYDEYGSDSDGDIILEAGPAIPRNGKRSSEERSSI